MPSSSLLFGWVLCACAVMAASQPVVGTQDQVDQLVDGMKKSMDAIVSHLKNPCVDGVAVNEMCIEPLNKLPYVMKDLIMNLGADGVEVDPAFCSSECDGVYGNNVDKYRAQFGGVATQSAGCDGTIPPYLLQGDGVSSSGKSLINAMQDYVCLTNSDGKKCVSSEVMGKTLRSSGVLELLRNPDGAMKKILDGLTNGVAPSNSDLGAVLSEAVASGTLPSLCTALNEGSCCAGSFVELLRKTTPSLCVGQLGSIFNTFGTLCAAGGNSIPQPCGGVDYSGLGSAPSNCPDIADAIKSITNLKSVSSSTYAGCTLPSNTCPRNDCELVWCKSTA